MDAIKVAKGNHAFYYIVVGMEILSEDFFGAILTSFDSLKLYGIHDGPYTGYIEIDCTDIKRNCSPGGFVDEVQKGLLNRVALEIPFSIRGEMNTDVVVAIDVWKFAFKITKYERDAEHRYEPVTDASLLLDDEEIGRFVELKVTVNQ